jgi:hypothetical protein
VARRIAGALAAAVLFVVALMVYMNVLASDAEVLARAEQAARTKIACKDCAYTRVSGTSRVIDKRYTFAFDRTEVRVVCRRAYIALGDFACSAR